MDQPIFVMPFAVAIVSIVVFVGLPLLAWILFRYFAHRERLEMIRHGYLPPAGQDIRGGRYGYDPVLSNRISLRRGISLAFIGLALLIGLSFIGYENGRFVLGPWLLGGLIPMLAGIAQAIGALVGGGVRDPSYQRGQGETGWPPPASVEHEHEQKDRR
jgi:hypothetical protein